MKEYDYIYDFNEELARVKLNDKFGFINKEGKEVIPLIYDYAFNFHEGLAFIQLDNKMGLINKEGIEVIPCK